MNFLVNNVKDKLNSYLINRLYKVYFQVLPDIFTYFYSRRQEIPKRCCQSPSLSPISGASTNSCLTPMTKPQNCSLKCAIHPITRCSKTTTITSCSQTRALFIPTFCLARFHTVSQLVKELQTYFLLRIGPKNSFK